MRRAIRVLVLAALAMGVMAIGSASASAVTVTDNGVNCGAFTSTSPTFEGGCEVTAVSENSVLTVGENALNCGVDIGDANVNTGGSLGIDAVDVRQNSSGDGNCDLVEPCLEPALPWTGSIGGSAAGGFTATVNFCVDTPLGTYGGPTQGALLNASGSTPPRIVFTNAAVGSSGATLSGTYDLSPSTLAVGD